MKQYWSIRKHSSNNVLFIHVHFLHSVNASILYPFIFIRCVEIKCFLLWQKETQGEKQE